MGQRAADTLVARIERPEDRVPRTISLEPSLVVRGTTARARAPDDSGVVEPTTPEWLS